MWPAFSGRTRRTSTSGGCGRNPPGPVSPDSVSPDFSSPTHRWLTRKSIASSSRLGSAAKSDGLPPGELTDTVAAALSASLWPLRQLQPDSKSPGTRIDSSRKARRADRVKGFVELVRGCARLENEPAPESHRESGHRLSVANLGRRGTDTRVRSWHDRTTVEVHAALIDVAQFTLELLKGFWPLCVAPLHAQ
jgi:hypothetical protein